MNSVRSTSPVKVALGLLVTEQGALAATQHNTCVSACCIHHSSATWERGKVRSALDSRNVDTTLALHLLRVQMLVLHEHDLPVRKSHGSEAAWHIHEFNGRAARLVESRPLVDAHRLLARPPVVTIHSTDRARHGWASECSACALPVSEAREESQAR